MSEESSTEPNKPNSPGAKVLWLLLAFVPSLLAFFMMDNNSSADIGSIILIVGIICCLFSGFGISGVLQNTAARIVLGLVLSAGFFVMNVIVVVLIGCSRMHF